MENQSNDDCTRDNDFPRDARLQCAAANAWLQRRLDADGVGEPDDVIRHRRACPVCRSNGEAAERLLKGLRAAKADMLPPGFRGASV